MRKMIVVLILVAATALLTGCHHGYYSGGFGYGYSSDVIVYGGYGGHRGSGHHRSGFGPGGHGHHGGHSRGHYGGHGGHGRGHH